MRNYTYNNENQEGNLKSNQSLINRFTGRRFRGLILGTLIVLSSFSGVSNDVEVSAAEEKDVVKVEASMNNKLIVLDDMKALYAQAASNTTEELKNNQVYLLKYRSTLDKIEILFDEDSIINRMITENNAILGDEWYFEKDITLQVINALQTDLIEDYS